MPIFCRKNVHSFRNAVLLCQFFQNFHQKPLAVMPIFDQKHQFYQNYTIIWAKKVNMMPFFFRFLTEKSSLSCPYFVKKRPFSKKHAALKSRFCQKNGHSLKNTVLLCHFFKIFMTNPLLSRPYLVKKTSILSK